MNPPLITVLLPTYNREEYLPRAIRCIVRQTFRDWKLIVANDGGNDVGGIVAAFGDPRIQYVDLPHRGKSGVLNRLLSMVETEYVAYMDDDDEVFPEHLETLYRAAVEHNSGFVFSDTYLARVEKATGRVLNECIENEKDVTPEMLAIQNFINHKQVLHRRVLAERIGGYDEELPILIDFDFIRRLAAAEAPFHVKKITGRHYLYYDNNQVTSISGLWQRDPAACGRAILRIYGKTPADLSRMYHEGVRAINLEPVLRNEIRKRDLDIRRLNPAANAKANAKAGGPERRPDEPEQLNPLRKLALTYAYFGFRAAAKKVLHKSAFWLRNSNPLQPERIAAKRIAPGLRQLLRKIYWMTFGKKYYAGRFFRDLRRRARTLKPIDGGVKVSILCCVWNTTPAYLRQMLRSIRLQSYKNWELIINNCSDRSHPEVEEIVRAFAARDARIKPFGGPNRGIALNTNAAAEHATGEFILLMDHDDMLLPEALEKLLAAQKKTDADFVYADEYILHLRFRRIRIRRKKPFTMAALESDNFINHPVLIRRQLFAAVGGMRAGFDGSQDHDLYFRLLERTGRVDYIAEPLYVWRVNPGSFSECRLEQCIESGKKAVTEHLKRINVPGRVVSVGRTTRYRILKD